MSTKKFVVAKNNTISLNDVPIAKDEVGIVERSGDDSSSIFFIKQWQVLDLKNTDFEYFAITETGDDFEKKVCNVCSRLRPTSLFQKNQNAKNNRSVRRPSCKDCRMTIDGQSMKANDKSKWLLQKPHLEPFECPICLKRTIPGLTSKVVLDHSHISGLPRAWICDSCNTGIGRFKDDVQMLKRAIEYLSDN